MSAEPDVADIVALVRRALPDWASPQSRRGLARELVILALLLDRVRPGGLEHQLTEAVRDEEAKGRRTRMAIRKCASEARGLLRYGQVGGRPLAAAADAVAARGAALILEIEALVMSVRKGEALGARVHSLAGERGGRPAKGGLRVLSALVRLGDMAEAGDAHADTELRLIEDYLRRRSA